MMMLWVKVLHIIFVMSWFAGLFYLPRIFVNLAEVAEPGKALTSADAAVCQRLLKMARKLYRFTVGLAVFAVVLGLILFVGYGIGMGPGNGWMHAKLFCVLLIIGYQHACGKLLKKFEAGTNQRSHVWYRYFNEIPVILLLIVVSLVILKPF